MKKFMKVAVAPLIVLIFLVACDNSNVSKESNTADSTNQPEQVAVEQGTPAPKIQLKDDKLNALNFLSP